MFIGSCTPRTQKGGCATRVLLTWPDEATAPLVKLNRQSMAVAEWGALYDKATLSLCSMLGFITLFIVHSGILFILLAVDQAKLNDPRYIPHFQSWFALIFIWPALMYLLQHSLLPTWRKRLEGSKIDLPKLSQQFDFIAVNVKVDR